MHSHNNSKDDNKENEKKPNFLRAPASSLIPNNLRGRSYAGTFKPLTESHLENDADSDGSHELDDAKESPPPSPRF